MICDWFSLLHQGCINIGIQYHKVFPLLVDHTPTPLPCRISLPMAEARTDPPRAANQFLSPKLFDSC